MLNLEKRRLGKEMEKEAKKMQNVKPTSWMEIEPCQIKIPKYTRITCNIHIEKNFHCLFELSINTLDEMMKNDIKKTKPNIFYTISHIYTRVYDSRLKCNAQHLVLRMRIVNCEPADDRT